MIGRRKFFGEASRLFASIGLGNIAFRQVGEDVMPKLLTQEQATQMVLMRKAFEVDMKINGIRPTAAILEIWLSSMRNAIGKVQVTSDAWTPDLWEDNNDE